MTRNSLAVLALVLAACSSEPAITPPDPVLSPDVRGVYDYAAPPRPIWPGLPAVMETSGTMTIESQEPGGAIAGTFLVMLVSSIGTIERAGTLQGGVFPDGRIWFRFVEPPPVSLPENDPRWVHEAVWEDGRIDGMYTRGPSEPPVADIFWAVRQ